MNPFAEAGCHGQGALKPLSGPNANRGAGFDA